MAKRKTNYFVLVFTDNGPVYVTSIDRMNKVAHWDCEKGPMVMTKIDAEDLVLGLSINGSSCVVVSAKYEVAQPYVYDKGEFTWKWYEEEKEE